jgi:hypothetical protein
MPTGFATAAAAGVAAAAAGVAAAAAGVAAAAAAADPRGPSCRKGSAPGRLLSLLATASAGIVATLAGW